MLRNKINLSILIILAFILTFITGKTVFSASSGSNFQQYKADTKQKFVLKREILKFLPFEELDKLLEKNKKLVYMSYKELKKLIEEKSSPEKPSPVDYVIKALSLNGEIKDDYVTFEGDYKIEILNKKWAEIPLLSTNTGFKHAEFEGKAMSVVTGNSFFKVISNEVGDHRLKIKFDVKNDKSGNRRVARFLIPDLAIAGLEIKHPSNTVDLNISNSTGLKTLKTGEYSVTSADITGKGSVEISWKTLPAAKKTGSIKKVKPESKPAKVISDINTLITIDEGLLQGFSDYSFRIYHSPVEQFKFQIPDDIEVIDIISPQNIVNKGNYKVTDPDKEKPGKLLTVYLNSKIRDSVNLNVIYEKTFQNKPTKLAIPDIYPVGKEINKVSGYVALQTSGNSEIIPVLAKNISRVDISDLPAGLQNLAEYPLIAAYSFINKGFSLAFEIIPHKDAPVQVAMTDKALADSRLSSNGVLTSRVKYTIRNMSEQFFKFKLPQKAEILSAMINGKSVQIEKQEIQDKKDTIYFVNIKNYQDTNPFNLVVMYRQKFNLTLLNKIFNFQNFELPRIQNMPVLTVSWSVYVPESMKYWNFSGLNPDGKDYFGYITNSYISRDFEYGYYTDKTNVAKQIAQNVMTDESESMESEGKVAGILPPEFSMPPLKGLKKYKFSDYLTGTELINISMLGISNFIYVLSFLLLIYIVWITMNKIYKAKNLENKAFREIIKGIIPELGLVIIIGIITYSFLFWLLAIITALVYAIFEFFKPKLLKQT